MQKCCRLDERRTDKGDKIIMKIKAEYIPHRSAYRLYVNEEHTIAYVDDLEEAEYMAIENGYDHLILEED